MKTRQLILCALFAALTAAGVFLRIPIPGTLLMFTLQTFFVFLTGLMLKPKYALIAQLVYIAIGLIGLPVFSKGGGLAYVFEPSFGFIPGFALCAFLLSVFKQKIFGFEEKRNVAFVLKACVYSLIPITAMYVLGIAYMYAILNLYMGTPVSLGYIIVSATGIFFFIDIAKFIVALLVSAPVVKRLSKIHQDFG